MRQQCFKDWLQLPRMSRQSDLSAYLARRSKQEPQNQERTTPSLLLPFQSSKHPKAKQLGQTAAVLQQKVEQLQQKAEQPRSSNHDSSGLKLQESAHGKREALSVGQVQTILGKKREQLRANSFQPQQAIRLQPQQAIRRKEDSEETIVIDESGQEVDSMSQLKLASCTLPKCPMFVLIGPFDTIFAEQLEDRLEALMLDCNKRTVLAFISEQAASQNLGHNLANLQKIEDQEFWCESMQTIVELLQKNKRRLSGAIRTLPYTGLRERRTLRRLEVFLLVGCMLLCVLGKQPHCGNASLFELMTVRPEGRNREKAGMRLEKLKCVINYLKAMCKLESIYEERILFERAVSYDYEYLAAGRGKTLLKAVVESQKIESGYCQGAILDFANSQVGGGFLTNGCAQEEILFSVFPELTVVKLICEELREEEAVIVQGARRFNCYSGYSQTFKFEGSYQARSELTFKQLSQQGRRSTQEDCSRSLIVAVDAVDYSSKLSKSSQYSRKYLRRELHKLYVGVEGALSVAQSGNNAQSGTSRVFTGKWGCGVFGGDEYLKFCLQWAVCSDLGLQMHFMHEDQQKVKELRLMVGQLQGRAVEDLLALVEQYGREGKFAVKGLLNYLKDYS